jgi:hypothetical protein
MKKYEQEGEKADYIQFWAVEQVLTGYFGLQWMYFRSWSLYCILIFQAKQTHP